MKDTSFFNAESAAYSAKRYPAKAATFTQFFFKRRLDLTLKALAPLALQKDTALLELGCADGIVAAAIESRFRDSIGRFDATDIAPEMISAARTLFGKLPIRFDVRSKVAIDGSYDAIIEVGVVNYTELEPELDAVASALKQEGRYICSIAGKSSLLYLLKGGKGYLHARTYAEYEGVLAKHFRTIDCYAVGFFIPHLWKIPILARILQPVVEFVLRACAPSLALEKVYVLEGRQN